MRPRLTQGNGRTRVSNARSNGFGVEQEPTITRRIDVHEYAHLEDIETALASAVHAIFDENFMTYHVGTQDGVIKFSADLTILNVMSDEHLELVVSMIVKEAMSQIRQ